MSYLLDSLAWSLVWFTVGYLLGLLDSHRCLRDLWKRDR